MALLYIFFFVCRSENWQLPASVSLVFYSGKSTWNMIIDFGFYLSFFRSINISINFFFCCVGVQRPDLYLVLITDRHSSFFGIFFTGNSLYSVTAVSHKELTKSERRIKLNTYMKTDGACIFISVLHLYLSFVLLCSRYTLEWHHIVGIK